MARTLSSWALQAAYAQDTSEGFILLLTIRHPVLSGPVYLSSDPTTRGTDATGQPYYYTESNSNQYLTIPFQISLPDDDPEKLLTAKLSIDNIDRSIISTIRQMGTIPGTLQIQIVTMSHPNNVEYDSGELTMRDVQYDALTVSTTMSFENILHEPYPGDRVSPVTAPGVFLT